MEKKKKRISQVNTIKRKKDFLKRLFGCTNNAITLGVRRHDIDLNDPASVGEFILLRIGKKSTK